MRGQRANTGQPEKAERPVPERHHPRPGKQKKGISGPMIQAMSPPFHDGSRRRALEKGCSPRDPGPKGTAQLVRLPPCPPRAGTESVRHNPPASRLSTSAVHTLGPKTKLRGGDSHRYRPWTAFSHIISFNLCTIPERWEFRSHGAGVKTGFRAGKQPTHWSSSVTRPTPSA